MQVSFVSVGPGLVGGPLCGSQCRTFVRRFQTPVLAEHRRMLRSPYAVVRERPVEYIFKTNRASPIIARGPSTRLGDLRLWRSRNRVLFPGRTSSPSGGS